MATRWSGIFPYLPSALTSDGMVDYSAMAQIVRRCLEAGVHGLTPLGSSGELPYLTEMQRGQVIDATIQGAAGRVPVIAGVGAFDTASLVRSAKTAVEAGSDGILLVPFAYFPLGEIEILSMIEAVTSAVDVPVVLYNHPHVTHIDLTTSIVKKAYYECGIEYAKDASGTISNILRWREATDDGVQVFSSTAIPPVAAMLLGACGWMSGPAAVFPESAVRIFQFAHAGAWEQAAAAQADLEPALEIFRRLGPGRAVKAMLRTIGIDAGEPVPPLRPLGTDEITRLATIVR